MNLSVLVFSTAFLLAACGERPSSAKSQAGVSQVPEVTAAPTVNPLVVENAKLTEEIAALKAQVEDLRRTPEDFLFRVKDLVKAEDLNGALVAFSNLELRYGSVPQTKAANALIAKLKTTVAAREAQARLVDAKGFYALKPSRAVSVNGFIIQVDSLLLGSRWTFNSYDSSYNYRDVERGKRFVLLKTTLKNTDKSHDPNLPDIAVYAIDGKEMRLEDAMTYEFRRWSSYGTYIGLHHDFKNDFAHTEAIPFTAATSIDESVAKAPFAVVATGLRCHARGEQIGQPEIVYRRASSCSSKKILSAEDFNTGTYRVLAFFNKPKGA